MPDQNQVISFQVKGTPIPKGSFRAFMPRGARYPIVTNDNKRTKPWQELIGYFANINAPKGGPWDGPIRLVCHFWMPRPKSLSKSKPFWAIKKPDLDKLLRTVKDSLKGIIYLDDAQVISSECLKNYGEIPGVDISIEKLTGTPPVQIEGNSNVTHI